MTGFRLKATLGGHLQDEGREINKCDIFPIFTRPNSSIGLATQRSNPCALLPNKTGFSIIIRTLTNNKLLLNKSQNIFL